MKFITTLFLALTLAANAAGGVTGAYERIKAGDSAQAVEKQIGTADNGPYAYTTPIGTIFCAGWTKQRIVVCFNSRFRVVWVGQANAAGKLFRQKGNKKLFLKIEKPKKPSDPKLAA